MKNNISGSFHKAVRIYSNSHIFSTSLQCRFCSTKTKEEDVERQNNLFNTEAKRQNEAIGRINKIKVQYIGKPKPTTLIMNQYISTPYNCAQHMVDMLVRRSALAMVDGKLWDMHRPLESDCELELLHFQVEHPGQVNKAFWRTCSLMLGYVARNAFKDHVEVKLHSFPKPNVRSGSFVYDIEMPTLPSWKPTTDELRILSAEMVKLADKNLPLERLDVKEELASMIFENNIHKLEQIPNIASQVSDKKVTLYRIGNHIDISRGPMISSTGLLGRVTISSVHRLETDRGNFYRYQGVALPKGIMLNHYAYSILEQRALKLNKGLLPWQYDSDVFQPELQTVEVVV